MGKRFTAFIDRYSNRFRFKAHEITTQANQYLCGLMQSEKKNMERMAEVVPDSDEQSLQHFLSNSQWDDQAVMDQVARDANRRLGGGANTALLIDESAITKKGEKSVGVARQWSGRLGKADNCQVGVYTVLSAGERAALIDKRLYLPKGWASDAKRCDAAKIPREHQTLKTKQVLALEMVRHQRRAGIEFAWVGADGGYGHDPAFLRALEDDGETFVVDVHSNQRIFLDDPRPQPAERKSLRGRPPRALQAQVEPIEVRHWAKGQDASAWKTVALRESTKGQLRVEILHRRVWLWDGREAQARHWHLIVRREIGSPKEIKYSLSNAPEDTPTARLAQMQGQRYWVERQFEDAKGEAGLDHYQARSWVAWHHHMALVAMAMLFMLEERQLQKADYPLLSCADIEGLLAQFLPRRNRDPDELIRQMEVRHRKRQASIDSAYRKQRRADEMAAGGP
jgi:SRSO17 transposase